MACYIVASGVSQVYHYSFSVNAHIFSHAYCVGQYISLQEILGSQIWASVQGLGLYSGAWLAYAVMSSHEKSCLGLCWHCSWRPNTLNSCEVIAFQHQPTNQGSKRLTRADFFLSHRNPLPGCTVHSSFPLSVEFHNISADISSEGCSDYVILFSFHWSASFAISR